MPRLAVVAAVVVGASLALAAWRLSDVDVRESPDTGRAECVVTAEGNGERVRLLGSDAALDVGRVYLDTSGCFEGDEFVRYVNADAAGR